MRAITRTLLALSVALSAAACTQDAGNDPGQLPPGTTLALTFVSGHLGNYWDCPDEAMSLPGARAAAPDPGADISGEAGDCAEEGCGLLNCDGAMLLIQVENTGSAPVDALTARDLVIHLDPPLDSEILAITDAATGAPATTLAPGQSVQLRVDFRGPPAGDWQEQFKVEVEVVGERDGARESATSLETPPLARLSAVAT
ncbi:MAG: hypothetical protein R3F60_27345 [bacterium]